MLVSIVTATYNSAETLLRAIESVVCQDYPHIEHVIVDGGSTDGTLELIGKHSRTIAKIVSEPDDGIYAAFNKGLRHSSGEVVAFLNSDDFYDNCSVVSKVVETFERDRSDFVFGDLVYVDKGDQDRTIRYWKGGVYSRRQLKMGWMPPHPSTFAKRAVFQEVGSFNPQFRISGDYDFLVRGLKGSNVRASYVNEVFVRMTVGGASNRSVRNIVTKMREDLRVIRKNHIGGIGTLMLKNLRKVGQLSTILRE